MAAQSVHRTTADEPDQTGCHEGPTIHFDRPVQEPPPLTSFISPCGPATLGASAEQVRWVRRSLSNFGPSIKR
jgi:hypothetical protein